ncbi:hypothetical protein D3C76_1136390 [compost metagenome]
MDFSLSIGSDLPKEELGKLFYDMLSEVLFVELINNEAEVWNRTGNQYVSVGCTYFSMSINLDDDEDYTDRYREEYLEAYGVDTNVFLVFNLKRVLLISDG